MTVASDIGRGAVDLLVGMRGTTSSFWRRLIADCLSVRESIVEEMKEEQCYAMQLNKGYQIPPLTVASGVVYGIKGDESIDEGEIRETDETLRGRSGRLEKIYTDCAKRVKLSPVCHFWRLCDVTR